LASADRNQPRKTKPLAATLTSSIRLPHVHRS
jgi:hypothetical protein